jgi:hypothetical protein
VDLAQVADELYGLDPAEFIAVRDERAREARAAGDRDSGDAIKKLRRPTVSAALLNRLVRDAADQVQELMDLGESLREAQEALAGDELRSLSARRRPVIHALAQEAKRLAVRSGRTVTDQVEREVEATLEAALADPAAADALRSGRLTTGLSYAGFGGVDVTGAVALPGMTAAAPPAPAARPRPSPVPSGGRAVTGRGGARTRRDGAGQRREPARRREETEAERRREQAEAERQREEADAARRRREADALAQNMREAQEVADGAAGALHEAEVRVAELRGLRQAATRRIEELEQQLELAQTHETEASRVLRDAERSRDAAARFAAETQRHFDRVRAKAEAALKTSERDET